MKIVLVKDSVNCTRCKAFLKAGCEPALAKLATVVVADKAAKPNSVWSKWLTKCAPFIVAAKGPPKKVNYPFILITDDAEKKVVGGFSAYDYKTMTPASVTAKVKAVCPECCDGCADEPVTPVKKCPTCGQVIATALVACFLTMFSAGCTGTRVNVTQAGGWSVSRLSILQKTEVPKINVKGVGVMDGYSNSGDVAMMQAMFEAAIKAAAKGSTAAVAP